jgi:hypothetical protein
VICWANGYVFGYFLWDVSAMVKDLMQLVVFEERKVSKFKASMKGILLGSQFVVDKWKKK